MHSAQRVPLSFLVFFLGLTFAACGGGSSSGTQTTTPPPVAPSVTSVSVACASATVPAGQSDQCSATVKGTGTFDPSVTWSVNSVVGGNATVGTISATGLYQAPATVPSTFTLNIGATSAADGTKSATASVMVAAATMNASKDIVAAVGGTIALPDGSSVVIPPNALTSDQTVTLSELSALPQPVPNQLVAGVGTALDLKLTIPNTGKAIPQSTAPRRIGAADQSASSDLQFNIVMAPSSVSGLQGSAPMAALTLASGQSTFAFTAGQFDSSSATGSVDVDPAYLSGVQEVAASMANFNSTAPAAPSPQWEIYWDGQKFQPLAPASAGQCPVAGSVLPANGEILILVHGMMSSVEATFPKVNDMQTAGHQPNDLPLVIGFDYDWSLRVHDNGAALAGFIDSLALCSGLNRIDIEAHSEGVPVSLSAGGQLANQNSVGLIKSVVSLGGPIIGTPLANFANVLPSAYLNVLTLANLAPVPAGALAAGLIYLSQLPVLPDLTDQSDPLLSVRDQFAEKLPKARVFAIGGDTPGVGLSALFGPLFNGHPNDGIVPLDSALGFAAGIPIDPLPPYHEDHWALVNDSDHVIPDAAAQIAGTSPTLACVSFTIPCLDPQGLFTFAGTGFDAGATAQLYQQDLSGLVTPLQSAPVDGNGMFTSDTTVCSQPVGTYSVFAFDNHLASNSLTQEVLQAIGCAPPTPGPSISTTSTTADAEFPYGSGNSGFFSVARFQDTTGREITQVTYSFCTFTTDSQCLEGAGTVPDSDFLGTITADATLNQLTLTVDTTIPGFTNTLCMSPNNQGQTCDGGSTPAAGGMISVSIAKTGPGSTDLNEDGSGTVYFAPANDVGTVLGTTVTGNASMSLGNVVGPLTFWLPAEIPGPSAKLHPIAAARKRALLNLLHPGQVWNHELHLEHR